MKQIYLITIFFYSLISFGQTKEEDFNKGLNEYNSGNFENALSYFQNAISFAKNDFQSILFAGKSNLQLENYSDAILYFDKLIELNPRSDTAYFLRGVSKQQLSSIDKESALKDFNTTVQINSNYAKAYYFRAETQDDLGNYLEVVSDLNRYISFESSNAKAFALRSMAHLHLGNYDKARTDWVKAIEINNDIFSQYEIYGHISMLGDDLELAMECFKIESAARPTNVKNLLFLGDVQMRLELYRESLQTLNNAIHIDTERAEAYDMRSRLKQKLNDFRGSIKDSDIAIQLEDTIANYYLNRAYSFFKLGNTPRSLSDLNKTIEIDKTRASAFYLRGINKLIDNRKDDGCLDLSKAGELGFFEAYEAIKEHCN